MAQAARPPEDEQVDQGIGSAEPGMAARPFIPYAVALVLVTCTYWSVDITSPALPEIQNDLSLSVKGAALVSSMLFLGRLLGNLPAARSLDRLGSPRTASIGGALLAMGATINMLSPTVGVLYAGRMVQGVGIALLVNAGLRSILVAKPGRGAAMTVFGLASTFGGVLGLQFGGFLTGHQGWRAVFALSACLGLMLTVLPVVGARAGRRRERAAARPAVPAVTGVPVRTYLPPLVINFLIFSNYSIWVILPLYAQREFDARPEVTANLLLVITLTHLGAAIPFSRLIRRFGSASVLVGALLLAVTGTCGILLARSVWMLVPPLILYGCGMIGAVNSAGDIVLHRGGADAKAVGALRQTSDLGLVVGPVVAGALVDTFGYGTPFIAFPALMVVAAAAGAFLPGVLRPRNTMELAG